MQNDALMHREGLNGYFIKLCEMTWDRGCFFPCFCFRMFSLQRMKEAGAFITTSESLLLNLCCGSDHPKFKQIQKIIWESAPDSGLLSPHGDKLTVLHTK